MSERNYDDEIGVAISGLIGLHLGHADDEFIRQQEEKVDRLVNRRIRRHALGGEHL